MTKSMSGITIAILSSIACHQDEALPRVHGSERVDVSMVQLIANPGEFHGRPVRVIGFCHLEFEGDALYLHREDFEHSIFRNAISLSLPNAPPGEPRGSRDEYVLLEGTFEANIRGHMGAYAGALKDVTRFERHDRLEVPPPPPPPNKK
jgi:hypothetical protein